MNQTTPPVRSLTVAGALILLLLSVAGTAGAYVIPHTASPNRATSPPASDLADPDPIGSLPQIPQPALPEPSTSGQGGAASRPSDSLAAWALPLAVKLSIPAVALQSYGYAELTVARLTPTCRLRWTTLAAIGKVESDHGRGNGATLRPDGQSLPSILGPALNGSNGMDTIRDTDGGELDQDKTWDHAVGPMQFIPSTWRQHAADADLDGRTDPNDIDDAALAAGAYLCASGKDMSTADGWYGAILKYNAVRAYADKVYSIANDYGVRSRA